MTTDRDRRSVLLVEDEPSIRDVLVELFDVAGTETCAVATLEEAEAALAGAARDGRAFDLVVTDLRLGGTRDGGLHVIATSARLTPGATRIVLTAFPDEKHRLASRQLGATHFLEKPADLSTIAALAADAGVPTAMFPHASQEVR